MSERESGYLPAQRTKERIVADAQRIGPLLHGLNKGAFNFTLHPSPDNNHFQPKALHRGFR